MYVSLLILDDNLSQSVKDIIHSLKNDNCLLMETNFESSNFEELTTQIQELYTERQVLGDDLDLNNIMFFNSKIEKNDVYMSYYKTEGKKILYNPHDYDNNFESWNTIKTFITYCIENFSSIENIDFFDINQLFYYKPWNEVYNNLLINDDISGSSIKIGFISNDFKELDDSIYYSFDDTNDIVNKTKSLSKSSNWLYDIFTNFKSQNSNVEHIFNTYFVMNDNNLNLLNSSSLFSLDFDPSKLELNNSTPYNNFLNILLVPLVNEYQRDDFPKLLKQLYQASNTCVIFLTDNETQQSLGLKVTRMITNYVGDYYKTFTTTMDESGNIQTIEGVKENIEMRLGVYLPPYWNDSSSPSREIKLSNNLTTISLDVSESQDVLSENILSSLVTLINTNFDYVNKIYFEIFNMNQNYNQSLDIIYTKLSEIESYQNKVAFYYSSFIQLDNDNNTIFWGNDKIVNTKIYNNIYYENGEKCYYYNEHNHNITLYLCSGNDNMADISPYIEKNKIHNFVLYDLDLDDSPENSKMYDVQKTLTPNTLIIPFNSNDNEESYERVISVIKNLASDSNVVLKNVSIFQDFIEDSETYSLFNNENIHQLKDVSLNDPELETWSEFKNFVLTLQNDLGVENLDLLMCKIYSDENWKYVLNKLETELTTLNIRSSDDNTGHIMFDGDWVLESESVDVNMIRVYFTEEIKNLEIVLGMIATYSFAVVSSDLQSIYMNGRGYGIHYDTTGFDGAERNYFIKADLYSSSGTNYGSSFKVLEEGEKIIQLMQITKNSNGDGITFLTTKNKLYSFGGDSYSSGGNLGIGDSNTLPSNIKMSGDRIKFPTLVKFKDTDGTIMTDVFETKKIKCISGGREVNYILFDDGDIYLCGLKTYQNAIVLGDNPVLNGKTSINYYIKYMETGTTQLYESANEKPIKLTAGRASAMVLTDANKLYSFGIAKQSTYGDPTGRNGSNRTRVNMGLVLFDNALETGEYVVDVVNGPSVSCCVTNLGKIYTCGDNFQTPLAQNTTNRGDFVKMNLIHNYTSFTSKTVRHLAIGTQTLWVSFTDAPGTYYVSGDGGHNHNRNLRGSDNQQLQTVDVKSKIGNQNAIAFFNSNQVKFFINSNGVLYSWGYNATKTLGTRSTSTTQKRSNPGTVYLGSSGSDIVDDVSFGPNNHEYIGVDGLTALSDMIEGFSSYSIPLNDNFILETDASSNYVYNPIYADASYEVDICYGMNIGIFKIKNVPSSSPLAILNSGQTDKISYFGTTEETVNTSDDTINIYVSSGNTSSPYYTFYTDSNGNTELSGNTLYLNRSYRFNRLNSATSHAFYISDAGYGNASTTIDISGDGTPTSGITGSQSFTVDFNGLTNSATLTFYCTVHSSMVGTFTLADSDGYTSPSVDLTGYKFYSGDVYIKVDESFNDLSLYTTGYGGSYLGTEGKIHFDPDVTYEGFTVDSTSSVIKNFSNELFLNLYQDSSNNIVPYFTEQDEISGNILDKFQVTQPGTYKIKNITDKYPLSITESGSSGIDISGDQSKKITQQLNSVNYDFYYGDLEFTVSRYGFNHFKAYVYNTFDSSFIDVYDVSFNPTYFSSDISLSSTKTLPYSSFFVIYPKSSNEVYVRLNEADELSGNFLDTFEVVNNGIYEIKNIPEKYMLNITEVDTSFVEITGTDTSMSTYSFGDVSYDFYHGNMYLKVNDNTEDICLNMMVYDTYNDISYNIGTKITIQKNIVDVFNPPSNDLSGLQFEYIANADKSTSAEWTANYVVSGTNKITMNSSFTLGTDTSGNKYYKMTGHTPVQPNYPDYQHILDIDADADNTGFMWETWVYPENNLTNNLGNNQNVIMAIDAGQMGPYFFINLQDSRGDGNIGMSPSVYQTYNGLTDNPGDINDYVGEMIHLIGYMYPETTTDYNRGVYVNGVHYPQLSTGDTSQSGYPTFTSIENNFSLGAGLEATGQSCVNLRFYSLRVWHQQLTSSQISTLYNAGPQASTLTTTPTVVTRGSGGLPDGIINFKYQPFDYTLSGNENFYCVGATKVHGYMRTETARTVYLEESSSSWNWARLQFVLFDKENNYRFTPGTLSNNVAGSSSTTVLYFEESGNYSPGKYGWTTTTNKTSLESSYDHFMIVGPTGNTNSYYYQDNGTPKYNPNWNMSYYSGNGASDVYSDIFALSLDEELTEDSILYPIQHIWNGNNYSPKNAKWMVGFTTNTSHISSDSKRYYDWNEKMKELVSGKSNGATVWGSDQLIYLYALKFESEEYIANFASTDSTTKLCLTLDVPESIETIGPYTVLDLHPTISKTEYIQTVDFGMAKDQTYIIEAPEDYPLAFVGSKNQTDISYIGYAENKQGYVDIGDVSYDLYSGPLFIQLNDDISASNEFTFYTVSGEDLNTTNRMIYDASCAAVIDADTSFVVPDSDNYNYNMKFVKTKDSTTTSSKVYTPGATGHSMYLTPRSTNNLSPVDGYAIGNYLISHHTGSGGKQYSYYMNSFAYLNETQAGTWNFGMRTTDDNFCSLYVLEGNYAWDNNIKYHNDTITFGTQSSPWTGTRVTDGVSTYTIANFMSWVNTNHPDANITKILEISQSSTAQANGSYTFQANTPYSILMYWRHNTTATGTSNVACRFGYWKQGESTVSLPSSGTSGSRTGGYTFSNPYVTTAGDALPPWFYRTITSIEDTTNTITSDDYILTPRFDLPSVKPQLDSSGEIVETFYSNQVFNVKKGYQYSFNQIPPWYPITILNNDLSNNITLTGESSKLVSGNYTIEVSSNDVYDISSTDTSGITTYYKQTAYNFYYGDVKLNVYDTSFGDISGISMYSTYNGGTKVGPDYMIQTKETPSQFDVDILDQITKVSVVQDDNGDYKYSLNGRNLYLDGTKYGVHIGTYVFTDIPENYAMAVMNNGIEDIIEYTGHTKKGDFTGPDGNSYSFYYESLTMQVKTLTGLDDISFSICSYNNGYMGGEGILTGMSEHQFNVMEQGKDFNGYSITTQPFISDDIMDSLQTEFIAGTSSTWTANYMKPGSNGSTTFTNQADLVQGSDGDGYYFRVNTTNRGAYLNNYPNQGELLLMDEDGTPGITFEIWFKAPTSLGSNKGWLMGPSTGWGPFLVLQDSRLGGMGTTPGATDNNTYNNLTNPGYINDNLNTLYHMVGYWKRNGSYFERGIYLNGVHYPQENTNTSGNSDSPSLDSISSKFTIGNNQGSTTSHSNGVYVYGFRIWHTKLDGDTITKLYNKGCNGSIVESDYVVPFPQINFKYQPFDYTYSENSNYYAKGAKLARGNLKVDEYSAYSDYTTTADRYAHRLMFVLEDADDGARLTPNTNSAHILALYDYQDTLTRDTGNANANNETLSGLYEYYMKVAGIGGAATVQQVFEDASGNPTDGYPSNTILNGWHQNYTSTYSHRFALSTDASLNEDSILYPIHYVHNGNDWNGGSRYLFTTYYYTNDKLGTDKERHSDWNAQLASSNSMLATGTNMYLYALDLGEEPSSSGGSGNIKLLPSIVEYTDSSGVDVSFSNPVIYNLTQGEEVAKGQFKYIYFIADSTYNTMIFREIECYVNGVNVALSSGGASAVWTKTDINTTTTSAHSIGASTNANDGTILKNGTDNNLAHGNGPNGWTRFLITLPQTYDVKDLQRAVIHLRHNSSNYNHFSGIGGKSVAKIQLLDTDKSTVVVEWDNTSSTYNGDSNNPVGTYVGIFEINLLGPTDDPNTTDFTIYDGSDTADLSMTTVEYDNPAVYKTVSTYYSECLINDASATVITTGPSGESVPLFNNDVSFEEFKVYSVYDGSYNINVGTDASNAIALLNYDVSNAISYTGTTLVNTKKSVYDAENTYNYYSGTVTVTVESSFNDVLIFEHLDASGIDNKFSKLMYSETCNPSILKKVVEEEEVDSSIVCLDATNIVNIINSEGNKYVLNGLSDYSSSRIYGVYQGNYEIRNIPVAHPMAILNNDVSNNVIYSGSELYATKEVDGISYNFYVGNLDITVMDRFTGRLSLYCYNHGYMGGKDVIKYTTTCGTDSVGYYIDCLDTQNNINVVGSKYLFNNDTEYDDERKYGLYTRLYTITNVPANHPIAFLNNDVSNVVSYYGDSLYDIKEVDGIKYNFYTGTVTLDITGSFDSFLSVYCYNHGYMGGQNLFKYSTICDYDLANVKPRVVEEVQINKQCLLTSSSYKVLFDSNNEEKIVLNYGTNTSYDSTLHYGLDIGNYIITNIPDSHPMAIINGEVSDKITYTGERLMLRKRDTNDNRMYNYYSGYIRLDVKSIPTNVNSLSFSSSYSTNMYEQGKFIFDNTCSLNDNFYSCLPTYSTVELSNNNILINNTDYNDSGDSKIALYTRYYQFTSVPKDNPIGFISISNEEHIYYHGLELNKTTIALDASTNIDLYSGTVTLGILDDFGYDLRMIMKQTNSNNYSDISMYYTDYCVYEGSQDNLTPTIKCINFNTTGNYTLDNGYGRLLINDTLPNYSRIYGFNIGLYKITIEEYTNAIRIVNTNINNNDIFLSVVDDDNIINYTKTIDGVDISYDYYYGDVLLHITTDVSYLDTGLIFDFANVNDYSRDNNLIFTSECLTNESIYTQCLDISSSISISNEYIILNNNDEYSSSTKFGLYVGDYYLNDIPSTNPIAILNNDISNNITYQGTTLYGTKDISGISYKFYTGSIRITVKGIFDRVSLYDYNNGFMGGEDILRYSELCDYVSQGFFTNPVNTTVSFNNRDSRRRILLTDSTEYNEFECPAYFVGTYTITDIPENNPVAVINSGLENAIGYTGTDLSGNYEVGDNFYNFYCGTLTIYIFEPFTNITIEDPDTFISLYSYNDEYMGTEEKLCYDNRISSYTDLSYTICVNTNSDIKMYNNPDESPDSSFNYTFNNAGEFYDYKIMGMHVGNYRLVNIPISDPIALLNVDVSNLITYTGKSSNKVTAFGPDGTTNYDFYYGNIDIEVIGDFGTLSAYSANGYYAGAQDVFKFTDYCETVGYVVECLTLETSMNIYDGNFTFNGGIYNSYKKFGLTEGSYSIKNIPVSQAVTFLNNDISNNVIISGDSIDLCGNFAGPDGNNYNYYTNEINITVKNKFDGFLPLYSYTDQSYNNGEELFVYSDLCTFINKHKMHTYCLSNSTTNDVSYATNDSSKIILDSTLETFDSKRNYGVYLGNYIFNIPQETPIAFLNNSVKTLVTYSGSESNKIRKSGPRGDAIYNYYYGKVVLNVLGNFGELEFHFLNKGFLGGIDNFIVYTDFCNDGVTNKAIECLTNTSRMNLIDNSGSYLYTLNSNSISNSNRTFGLHEGMYTITDICDNYPIAIMNNGLTQHIDYTGSEQDLCGNFTASDGNNYNFYKNEITLVVNSDFTQNGNISIFSYGSDLSGNFGLENKLTYSDLCEDTTTQEYEQVNDDIVSLDFYLLQASTY